LPNHPAEIDPVIVMALLSKDFAPRPLIIEHFYRLKGFRFFIDLVGAMPLPTMEEKANKWRAKRVERTLREVRTEFVGLAMHLRRHNEIIARIERNVEETMVQIDESERHLRWKLKLRQWRRRIGCAGVFVCVALGCLFYLSLWARIY